MLNKKGFNIGITVILIFILVGTAVVALALSNILGGVKSSTDIGACKTSVVLKSITQVGPKDSPVDLQCKTNLVKIETTDLNEIKEEIATEFALCFTRFHKGKIDFLSQYDWKIGQSLYCFVCSRISFSDEVKGEYENIEILDYLNKEKIINRRTVAFYLTNDTDFEFTKQQIADIDTSRNLYVLYAALRADPLEKKLLNVEEVWSKIIVTSDTGADPDHSSGFVLSSSEVAEEICLGLITK